MTNREIIKIIYKIKLNKALKINEITNKILQQFVDVATKQLRFFLINVFKKTFNHHISRKFLQ